MLIQFKQILNDDAIIKSGKEFEIKDQRKRKLPLTVFFWLMIFSATTTGSIGCLAALCALFTAAFANLFPEENPSSVTKAAVSKKMSNVNWLFFKDIFDRLLKEYHKILPGNTQKKLTTLIKNLSAVKAVDSTVVQICKKLEAIFASTKQGIATLKINFRFDLCSHAPDKINVTEGKCHDSNFKFFEPMKNILYVFDLGYYCHLFFDKIMSHGCFFVSRLKYVSSVKILKALDKFSPRNVVGLSLTEICAKATHGTLDLLIELGKAQNSKMTHQVRLIGILHEDVWYFYITNLFQRSLKPRDFFMIYSERWQIEIFFNQLKTYLSIDRIFSCSKNGIMIQIYAALIFFLLCQICIALAVEKTNRGREEFSFKVVVDYVGTYLKGVHSLLSAFHSTDFFSLLNRLTQIVACIPKRSYSPDTVFY